MKNYNLKFKSYRIQHFCVSLYVAIEVGLYLHPALSESAGVWHVVSEEPCVL